MLYTTRINNLLAACPRLSRVWLKTGDPRRPLKCVWLDEARLHEVVNPDCSAQHECEAAELTEDHLWLAA